MSTARYTRPTTYFFHPSVERVVRHAELPMPRIFLRCTHSARRASLRDRVPHSFDAYALGVLGPVNVSLVPTLLRQAPLWSP
jgi:hypothetical protein